MESILQCIHADKLASQGEKLNNSFILLVIQRKFIKARPRSRKDDFHLDRPVPVTIFRLRTGHNRLNAHAPKSQTIIFTQVLL